MPLPDFSQLQQQWKDNQAKINTNIDGLNSQIEASGSKYVRNPMNPSQLMLVNTGTDVKSQVDLQKSLQSLDPVLSAADAEKLGVPFGTKQSEAKGKTPTSGNALNTRRDALLSALGSLDAAETNLVTAGGAKGPLGFLTKIPILGQYINPKGAAYSATKIELATQMAKALTGGSRPAENIIRKYIDSLPDVTDRPTFAQAKLDKLRQELVSQAKTFNISDIVDVYGGGGSKNNDPLGLGQ